MAPRSSAHCSVGVLDILHARGIHAQGDLQILGRHGDEILGYILLRIGVLVAAQLRINGGDLVGAQARAAAERHVLLGVGHAGKTGGRFVAAGDVILLYGDDRRQRVAHDHHAQAVIERGPDYIVVFFGGGQSCNQECREQQHEATHKFSSSHYAAVLLRDWELLG